MQPTYTSDGYLHAIYPNDGGRAIAILTRTTEGVELHPEYDTQDARDAIALFPLFDPDKVVVAHVLPDWQGFRQAITISPAYLSIVATDGTTQALNSALIAILWRVGDDPALMLEVAGTWNAIATIANPSEADIAALNAIALSNNVPLQLNEQGLIAG